MRLDDPQLLSALLSAGWRPPSRLDQRDMALRRLATTWYCDVDERHRPAVIAHALDRETMLRSAPEPGSRRAALREVLTLNDGASLSRVQIRNVLHGSRCGTGTFL